VDKSSLNAWQRIVVQFRLKWRGITDAQHTCKPLLSCRGGPYAEDGNTVSYPRTHNLFSHPPRIARRTMVGRLWGWVFHTALCPLLRPPTPCRDAVERHGHLGGRYAPALASCAQRRPLPPLSHPLSTRKHRHVAAAKTTACAHRFSYALARRPGCVPRGFHRILSRGLVAGERHGLARGRGMGLLAGARLSGGRHPKRGMGARWARLLHTRGHHCPWQDGHHSHHPKLAPAKRTYMPGLDLATDFVDRSRHGHVYGMSQSNTPSGHRSPTP